ncbi:hypothetical protein GQ53DRAFT_150209 [Thozetella sp. PMI_491]|nr:hypothetical protein GQ53DRAFT_150209 [Thozetella sp. PMI_491]
MFRVAWPSMRLGLWPTLALDLITAAFLAVLTRAVLVLATTQLTYDNVGPCPACRTQRFGLPPDLWDYCMLRVAVVAGVLAALAFPNHERYLRQEDAAAAAQGKQLGQLVRPRTRGRDQRSFYMRSAVVALFVLPATVACIFELTRARTQRTRVKAGLSFPLEALNETYLSSGPITNFSTAQGTDMRKHEAMQPANPFLSYHDLYPNDTLEIPGMMQTTAWYLGRESLPELEAFMYQSAASHVSESLGRRSPLFANVTGPQRSGVRLGDASYATLLTEGIGLNLSSYQRFLGDGLPGLPRNLTFLALSGDTYATNATVQCRDISYLYNVHYHKEQEGQGWDRKRMIMTHYNEDEDSKTYDITRDPTGIQIVTDFRLVEWGGGMTKTVAGKVTKIPGAIHVPTQLIIIPNWTRRIPLALVAECAYRPPVEYHKLFWITHLMSAIYATHSDVKGKPDGGFELIPKTKLNDAKCLSPLLSLPAARAIHELLSQEGQVAGGAIARAFRDVGFEPRLHYRLAPLMEMILTETAAAYFSLLRQRVEIANFWPQDDQVRHPGAKPQQLEFDYIRLGGTAKPGRLWFGAFAWLVTHACFCLLQTLILAGLVPFTKRFRYSVAVPEPTSTAEKEGLLPAADTKDPVV